MTTNRVRDLPRSGSALADAPSHGRGVASDLDGLHAASATSVATSPSPLALVAVFVLMAILVALDLVTDLRDRTEPAHVVLEVLVVTIGFAAAGAIALRLRRSAHDMRALRDEATRLADHLRVSEQAAAQWRSSAADLIAGLSAAIDEQFARWELSPAERDVALLLLKGLSHKEIAEIRSVSDTTVRQQARSMYRKAGLSGRHDLAAFFLEDLLGPRPPIAHPCDGAARQP